ncbi:hypothetical protein [Streptomyces sp. NPDC047108]|uniref:hypothetical protein n=1 Tax=Streptomyces sp. NPDC047108 TaxID=3155025 RepID=UPI0033C29CE6
MEHTDKPHASPTREALRRYMARREGMVRAVPEGTTDLDGMDGYTLSRGSMAYPPCRCPRCRKTNG